MGIEDIKGYKPHTDDKIGKVNAIKDAEVRLGLIFDALMSELWAELDDCEDLEESTNISTRLDQISIAKTKLKEASMWACRSVFQPEENY